MKRSLCGLNFYKVYVLFLASNNVRYYPPLLLAPMYKTIPTNSKDIEYHKNANNWVPFENYDFKTSVMLPRGH